jgi:hypothetical protein
MRGLLSGRFAIASDQFTPAQEALLDELVLRHPDDIAGSKYHNIGRRPVHDQSPRGS